MRSLRAYAAIVRIYLRNNSQYRLGMWFKLLTNIFWGYVGTVIVHVYYKYGFGAPSDLTMGQAVSMIWLMQIAINLLPGFGVDLIVWNGINKGDVGIDLLRPLGVYGYWYSRAFAGKVSQFMLAVVPVGAAALLVPGELGLGAPASVPHLAACLVTLFTGLFLSCACINLSYAMCMDAGMGPAPANILMTLMQILAGGYLPLQLWPDAMQKILYYQPFAAMGDLPLRFYVGAADTADIWVVLLIQLVWGVALGLAGRAWIGRNARKIVIQGG